MKCVILAGGKGTRISELSKRTPKPMIDKSPSVGSPVEYKPAVEVDPNGITPPVLAPAKSSTKPENDQEEPENKSLFDRLFKKPSNKEK